MSIWLLFMQLFDILQAFSWDKKILECKIHVMYTINHNADWT